MIKRKVFKSKDIIQRRFGSIYSRVNRKCQLQRFLILICNWGENFQEKRTFVKVKLSFAIYIEIF